MILALALALGVGCAHRGPAPAAQVDVERTSAPLDPRVRAALEEGTSDLDVGVRRVALAALVAADPAAGGGPWALRGRYDPSEYVRRAVVDALAGRLREPETRAAVRAILADAGADPWTRGAAALALVDGARAGTVPEAERADDRAVVVRSAAEVHGARAAALLLAAAAVGDGPAAERLREQIASGNLPLELWMVRAIGAHPEAGLAAALVGGIDVGEPEVRLAVAAALLALGDGTGERVLGEALAADEDTALEALDYLADTPSPRALSVLGAAPITAPIIREASEILRFAHGDGNARAVAQARAGPDQELRRYAARAAARRFAAGPPPEGADRLRAGLRDSLA
jgi:hypothetical protein